MIKSLLILLLIVITTYLLSRHLLMVEKEYTAQLLNNPEQLHYAHQFKNFTLTNTDSQGNAQSIIHSPTTNTLSAQQKTLMQEPKIIMQGEQEAAPIIITAKQAEIFHLENQTLLRDDVKVTLHNDANNKNIVMTTEQLTLNNSTQTATTELPAKIVHSRGTMQGTGVEFNPHTKQIKFLNNVRGIYE